jgi:hypothetical protein
LYGTLNVHGGGSGSVWAGDVFGTVELGIGFIQGGIPFAGAATFSDIKGGAVVTENGADLDGTIWLTGSNGGDIIVSGDLLPNGKIFVEDAVTGRIDVRGNSEGEITIGDGSTGLVLVNGHMSGPLTIEGDASVSIVADADGNGVGDITGDVLCLGVFDGEICAANIPPGGPLPSNINLGARGPGGPTPRSAKSQAVCAMSRGASPSIAMRT